MSKTALQKVAPEWHAQIAAELNREFAETNELNETARMRRIRLGLMFIFVKEMGKADKSIPHGQFGPWLELNCTGIPRATAGDYITEVNSVFDLLKWQKSEIRNFEVPPHRLLALEKDDSLTSHDKKRRAELLKIVEQQSRFRAVTRYAQVELNEDDATAEKRGRIKGEGGKPAEFKGSIEEVAAARKKVSRRHLFKAADELEKVGIDFIAVDDGELTAVAAALERSAKCINAWLTMPATKRDANAIQKLWKTL